MSNIKQLQPTRVFFEVKKAHEKGYRIISAQGGTRSGKTYNILIWILVTAWNNPGLRINIIRATMPTLKKTAYKDFKEIAMNLNMWDSMGKNRKDMEFVMPNGSEFNFVATEDESKMRGLKGNINFINEATEDEKTIFDHIAFRTENKVAERDEEGNIISGCDFHGVIILDYNPSFPNDHWVSKLNTSTAYDSSRYFFKTTYKDNPYLSDEQRAAIEIYRETDYRMWRIYGEGEQCMAEGLIFENYNVVDRIPDHLLRRAFVGVDWGYKDPFAVVLVALDNRNRQAYLKEVCYKQYMTEDQMLAVLTTDPVKGRPVICDNAEPRLINRARQNGVHIRAAKKRTMGNRHSIVPGIQVMKGYTINITSDSRNGLIEADNYTWEKDRNGNWTDEPGRKFNHFWDAARYVFYTEGTSALTRHRGIRIMN